MKIVKICKNISWDDSASLFSDKPDIRELSFKDFIDVVVNGTEKFGQGAKNIRSGVRILDALESAIKGNAQEFAVETDDWEKLWSALDSKRWPPRMAQAAERAGWLTAIEKAEDQKTATDK